MSSNTARLLEMIRQSLEASSAPLRREPDGPAATSPEAGELEKGVGSQNAEERTEQEAVNGKTSAAIRGVPPSGYLQG